MTETFYSSTSNSFTNARFLADTIINNKLRYICHAPIHIHSYKLIHCQIHTFHSVFVLDTQLHNFNTHLTQVNVQVQIDNHPARSPCNSIIHVPTSCCPKLNTPLGIKHTLLEPLTPLNYHHALHL